MSQSAPNLDPQKKLRAISAPYQFVERNLFLGINLPEKELNKLEAFTAIVVYKMYVAGLIVPTVQCPLGKDCKSTKCMFCRHAAASAASSVAPAYVAENAVTLQKPMQTTKNVMQLPQPMPPTKNAMRHESPLQVHPILLPPGQQHSIYVPHPIPLNQEVDPSHVKWYGEMTRSRHQLPAKPVAQKRIEIINLEEDECTIQNGTQPTKRDINEREVGEILAEMGNISKRTRTHENE
jgi:hypothetical protein